MILCITFSLKHTLAPYCTSGAIIYKQNSRAPASALKREPCLPKVLLKVKVVKRLEQENADYGVLVQEQVVQPSNSTLYG
jgi:hypothetical protein